MAKKKARFRIVKLRLDKDQRGIIDLVSKTSGESSDTVVRVLISLGILRHLARLEIEVDEKTTPPAAPRARPRP